MMPICKVLLQFCDAPSTSPLYFPAHYRRFHATLTLAELRATLVAMAEAEAGRKPAAQYRVASINYVDDEGDTVCVASETEWRECLRLQRKMACTGPGSKMVVSLTATLGPVNNDTSFSPTGCCPLSLPPLFSHGTADLGPAAQVDKLVGGTALLIDGVPDPKTSPTQCAAAAQHVSQHCGKAEFHMIQRSPATAGQTWNDLPDEAQTLRSMFPATSREAIVSALQACHNHLPDAVDRLLRCDREVL